MRSIRGRVVVVLAGAAVALLICGCGGSGDATSGHAGTSTRGRTSASGTRTSVSHARTASKGASALAFARCMRSHGVQHWPDPSARGAVDKSKLTTQQLGVSQSVISAAGKACQRLLPQNNQSAQTQDAKVMSALWKFARCLRGDGVTHWPDPLAESDPGQPNTPGFPRSMPGVNQNAPQVRAAENKCQHLMASIGYAGGGYP